MSGKKSSIIYHDLLSVVEEMPDEMAGRFVKSLLDLMQGKALDQVDFSIKIALHPFISQFKRDNEKYQSICQRNRLNGKSGGRPPEPNLKVAVNGKSIPPESKGYHFLYLIKDTVNNEYKIGETKNLIQRRYDIKRPSADLIVCDFFIGERSVCIESEREFITNNAEFRVSGDWFEFVDMDDEDIIDKFYKSIPKNPDGSLLSQIIPNNHDTDTDTDTDTDKEEKIDGSDAPPKCPHWDIISIYHEVLPSLTAVKIWSETRQGLLRARWREEKERQDLKWWRDYFTKVSRSSFLTGKTEKPFKCDLEWLVRPTNFIKVLEGKYHNDFETGETASGYKWGQHNE